MNILIESIENLSFIDKILYATKEKYNLTTEDLNVFILNNKKNRDFLIGQVRMLIPDINYFWLHYPFQLMGYNCQMIKLPKFE